MRPEDTHKYSFLECPVLGSVQDIEVCLSSSSHLLAPLISCYRVQKCVALNHMSTKNLALLFAPSLFQTDGKGEHEVKVMEDLIDNYVHIFNVSALSAHPALLVLPYPDFCFAYLLTASLWLIHRLMRTRCHKWIWRTV